MRVCYNSIIVLEKLKGLSVIPKTNKDANEGVLFEF